MREHGTSACYAWGPEPGCLPGRGCRCSACSLARAESDRSRRQSAAPPYVSATPVREHLAFLSSEGVGWKRAARAAGLSSSVVWKIVYGRDGKPSRRCRPETAERLLGVTPADGAAGSRVDAAPTWEVIRTLLGRGWTKYAISRALGSSSPLQTGTGQVRRQTALAIKALLDEPVPSDVGVAWSSHHRANAEPEPEVEAVEPVRYDVRDRFLLAVVEMLEDRIDQRPWRARSACQGKPSWLFFPARGDTKTLDAAKAVCLTCPVAAECLAANLGERDGVFGGMSGAERRELRSEAVA